MKQDSDEQRTLTGETKRQKTDSVAVHDDNGRASPDFSDDKNLATNPAAEKRLRGFLSHRSVKFALAALLVAALTIGGLQAWDYFQSYVSTEDAQVEGDIVPVSSRIEGTVSQVYVHDTQFVRKGTELVALDPSDYELALRRARAGLAEAQAQAAAAQSQFAQAQANLGQAQADNVKAQGDVRRYSELLKSHVVSNENYDDKLRAAKVAKATVNSDLAAISAAKRMVAVRQAGVLAAKAALDQALLNLRYTRIYAPMDGVVGNKTVQVGEHIAAGQGMLEVTDISHLWITANFKETAFGDIRPGQQATIYVDALGRNLNGYVSGLGGATGALFSLLPPENATGNWIKVVQRLPVRLHFDPSDALASHLRPGQSVEVKIWLRKPALNLPGLAQAGAAGAGTLARGEPPKPR